MRGSYDPPPQSSRPRDGPATTFEVDQVMVEILDKKKGVNENFGLVLVVGWPPNKGELERPLNELVEALRSCFDQEDREKNAYFYPIDSLHVTVATLHAFTLKTSDPDKRVVLEREWRNVVVAASKRPEWPKQPLKLEIDSCQIGSRAGILLWRETTGGLKNVRCCLQEETLRKQTQMEEAGVNVDTLQIPRIVHSTVLRFPSDITTNGEAVQERFQTNVLPRLTEIFTKPITANTAVLVCERTPYLHHPYDDQHALKTIKLTDET